MPAEIYSGPYSLPITSKSAGLEYLIRGAANEIEARNKLVDEAPLLYDRFVQDDYRVEDMQVAGGGWYKGTVSYKAKADPTGSGGGGAEPTRSIEFSTMGGSKFYQIAPHGGTAYYTSDPWEPRVPVGLINCELDGNKIRVKGGQFPSNKFAFKIKKRFSAGSLTDDVVDLIESLSDSVNSDIFLGFEAETVLFLGAEGSQSGTDADVTFYFEKDKTINQTTDGIDWAAGPFDYVWFLSAPTDDSGVMTTRVKEVHVDYMKQKAALSTLPL